MLQKDLYAQKDQDDAAGQLCLALVPGAEDAADLHAQGGEQEGDDADEADGWQDADLQKGEGHAHGQGVDAGGDGHDQHGLEAQGGVYVLRVLVQGLPDHVGADEHQQYHGDPVVHRGDVLRKAAAQQIPYEGHQRLKAAEPEAHDHHMLPLYLPDGQALADGYGKGVHGQAHRQNEQFKYGHTAILLYKQHCAFY